MASMQCPTCKANVPEEYSDWEGLQDNDARGNTCSECGTSFQIRFKIESIEVPESKEST